ncbi:MAG TPA: Rid family detoxifying hydrolase [Gemmatimonadaceae bacterium]|nr:Rid family detoxifying hydrolase [Gemmatimonadaceae bacterium]
MRRVVRTPEAPAAVGPYSQGIAAAPFVWTAGQVGLDPATGKLVPGGIEAESRRTLQNIQAILASAGAGLEDVVKVTVFLTRMDDFAAMNRVYAEFFLDPPPARTTVAVQALPAGALVEIDALAFRP